MSGTSRLGVENRPGVLGEPFCSFFHKVMRVKNASLWDRRSGGRVQDRISAQIEDKYSLFNDKLFAPH